MSQPFTYHASALGLGGVLNVGPQGNRVRTILPSAASVALSPTGGEGRSSVENYSNNGISFNYAQSTVIGYESGGEYITRSDVTITGLNVFNRLIIQMMQATIESRHDATDSQFTIVHAAYSGVTIDDVVIEPQLDLSIGAACPKFSHLEEKLLSDKPGYSSRFGIDENTMLTALSKTEKPQVAGSLTSGFVQPGSNQIVPRKAYGLQVKNFGRAHFAEYHAKPGRRRITLLRLDLDTMSDFMGAQDQPFTFDRGTVRQYARTDSLDGTVSLASVEGNGSPPWQP